MIYDLSNSEKKLITANRLSELNLFAERSGTKLSLCNVYDSTCICGLKDEVLGNTIEITLNNEELDKIYEFLKERHKLIKELEYLETIL